MNRDIRIATSFLTHRKRKKLKKALGSDGVLAFIDLLLSTAMYRPDGILRGLKEEDIALDAQWDGDENEFVETLIQIGFLEKNDDGVYQIHDWIDHNGYASSAEQRSDKARFSNLKRWHPEIAKQLKLQGIEELTADRFKAITEGKAINTVTDSGSDPSPIVTDSGSDPPAPSPAPSPSPSPSPAPSPSPSPTDTPLTPLGGLSGPGKKLQKALIEKIQTAGHDQFRDKLLEFFRYRMTLPKKQRYKTEKGLDGLIRDFSGCIAAGLNPAECIDIAMEREWLTPSPEYFSNKKNSKMPNGTIMGSVRMDSNLAACQAFINGD